MRTVYGTQAMSALQILESTLNLREIKIYRGSEYLEEETLAALEKQRIIKNAFKEWVWKDADIIRTFLYCFCACDE